MVVVVKHATIFTDAGNKVDVSPFTPDYQALENVSISYAAVQYMCQYMSKLYIIMFRNSIPVTSMVNNLTFHSSLENQVLWSRTQKNSLRGSICG